MTRIIDNGKGWPGTRYTPSNLDPEVLAAHVARVRDEMADGEHTVEDSPQQPDDERLARLGEALDRASTVRPGYWW